MCVLGKDSDLKKVLGSEWSIQCDIFERSPFYYAIASKNQKCVDALIDHIVFLSENSKTLFISSLFSIRNDFKMIIGNSSKKLHLLLNAILMPSDSVFFNIDEGLLPLHNHSDYQTSAIQDFTATPTNDEIYPTQLVFMGTSFPIPWQIGSKSNIELLEAILECNNLQIYKCVFVQHFILYQWKNLYKWIRGYTVLTFLNVVLLFLLIQYSVSNLYILFPYIIINIALITWEGMQIASQSLDYFKDILNLIDVSRVLITGLWIILESLNIDIIELTWIATLLNLTRGLTGFKLFDGTRYYVSLITRSFNDIKYFIIMFIYSNLAFGLLFIIARKEPVDFTTLWINSYGLNFGNYDAAEGANFRLEYTVFMAATVINVLVMLNMIISILGDTYDNFQMEMSIIDFKEKADLSLEVQKIVSKVSEDPQPKYFKICCQPIDEDDETWEGKVLFIDKKLERIMTTINADHKSIQKKSMSEINIIIEKNVSRRIIEVEGRLNAKLDAIMKTISK